MQLTMLQLTLGGKWAWGGFRYVDHPPRGHHRAGLWASAPPTRPTTSSRVNIYMNMFHLVLILYSFKRVKMQIGQFKPQKWIPRVCFGSR